MSDRRPTKATGPRYADMEVRGRKALNEDREPEHTGAMTFEDARTRGYRDVPGRDMTNGEQNLHGLLGSVSRVAVGEWWHDEELQRLIDVGRAAQRIRTERDDDEGLRPQRRQW